MKQTILACVLTCRAEGPGNVEVEVVGSVDGHVQVLVGLETTHKQHSCCLPSAFSMSLSRLTDVHVEAELPSQLASDRVGECVAETLVDDDFANEGSR